MSGLAVLAAVVAFVVGHPVPVACAPLPQTTEGFVLLGWAEWPDGNDSITLAPSICDETAAARLPVSTDDAAADLDAGGALLLTVHEAEHIRYHDRDEAVTECRALRDYDSALTFLLGPHRRFDLQDAQERALFQQGAARFDQLMPGEYHGGYC